MSSSTLNGVRSSDSVVLFSGGWDSLFCYAKALRSALKPDLLFFNSGQPYLQEELTAIQNMMAAGAPKISVVDYAKIKNTDGIFDNRNSKFLEYVAARGYSTVYFGSRNVIPFFDKYGDSNWWFAKQEAQRLGLRIETPATAMPKFLIRRLCGRQLPHLARFVFSSEGLS